MAAVSINRILSTQDRIVLDQEYTTIMNNLNLGNIRPDSEIMELYRRILDTISRKRLRSEESEFLQARYDSEMKNTISQVVSAVAGAGTAIAVNGGSSLLTGNVYGALGSIADGVMSGYFIYQNNSSVRNDIDHDLWKLKAEEITDMNEIQKQLLTSSWNLLNQYKLPDSSRLVENTIKEFHQAAETQDIGQRLRMLRALEKDFRVYPPYWYYRAKAAREAGDLEDSRKCLDEFAGVWRPVLRQDPYMLEVCKFRIHDALSSDKPAAEIRADVMKYADLAAEHTPRSDWADNLFLGTVYFALGDKEKGIESVRLNDDFGHEKQISAAVVRQMESGTLNFWDLAEELGYVLRDSVVIPLQLLGKFSDKAGNLARSKKGFMSLYISEYGYIAADNMRLAIDEAISEHMASLSWWEKNFSIDTDEVQKRFLVKFKPVYETFLVRFQQRYYSTLGTELTGLGAKGFISLSRQILNYPANISEKESQSGGWLYWLFMPLRLIWWMIVGIFTVIASIISFFAMIINFFGESPAITARNILLERNQAIYTTELPAKYWTEIEPIIKKVTELSHD